MKITSIILNPPVARGSDMKLMFIFKRIASRIFWKCMGLASRPIKASLWYRYLFVDYDHQIYPDNVWYREHAERNFDVVSLGSSGGRWAYDWQSAGVKGMNWAQQPQTLIDDFRILKNFHSILRKGGTVIITIMPFTSLNKKTGVMDTLKYLPTLYWDVVQDMPYLSQAQKLRAYPILFRKSGIKAAINHILRLERPIKDWRVDVEINPMTDEKLELDSRAWMDGWAKQFSIKDFEAPLTMKNAEGRNIRIGVMREMIDFCIERGYRPVYVVPPVSPALAKHFTIKFREVYINDFLRDVDRTVEKFDYTNDCEFADNRLYFNSFFLNKPGRERFTRRLVKDLMLKS